MFASRKNKMIVTNNPLFPHKKEAISLETVRGIFWITLIEYTARQYEHIQGK